MLITNSTMDCDPTLNDVDSLVYRDPTDTEMTPKKVVILTVMTTSNVFMLLGNAFSIYIILCSRSLRRHTYYWLVLNLAVLDLMNSSFVVPINIVWEFHGNWPFSQLLCDLEIFCDVGFSTVAAYSTVLLALDKYLYITKPFFYHTYVGPKWTVAAILGTWVVWMTYAAASVFGGLARSTKEYKYSAFPLDNCNFVLRHVYAIISFVLVFFIPLVILIFASSRILYVARQHIRKIHNNHRASDAATSSLDLSAALSPNTNNNGTTTTNNNNATTTTPHNTTTTTPTARVSFTDTKEAAWPQNTANISSHNQGHSDSLAVPSVTVQHSSGPESSSRAVPTATDTHTVTHTDTHTGTHTDTHTGTHTVALTDGSPGASNAASKTSSGSWPTRTSKKVRVSSFRAFGTVTLVVFAYIVMFAPFWVAHIVNLGCLCIKPMIFEDYLTVLYYMHSLVNPYIYMATDRRYKKAIQLLIAKSKLCRRCKRTNVSSPVVQISSIHP